MFRQTDSGNRRQDSKVDQDERNRMLRELTRLRSSQANKKAMLSGLDLQKDKRRIDDLIAQIAGLEGEIASIEMKL